MQAAAEERAPARERMVASVSYRWSGSARAKSAPRRGAAGSGGATIKLAAWNPQTPYLKALDACADCDAAYAEYLQQKKEHGSAPAFYMDCAGLFFRKGWRVRGWRILSNMAEFKLEDAAIWRSMGWRLREAGQYNEAEICFRKALKLRNEEGQSRRDLALVLSESGKAARNAAALTEAMALLKEAAFTNFARRSGRRSNDRQVSIVALEELNALIAWCAAVEWPEGTRPTVPELDAAYRRDLPVKIRIVLSWDADETDIDLHVLEPDGEEAYYGHRRTSSGGFVSEDVTTGYGPEEYLRKEGLGTFKILSNYFASHQTALTGATTVTATVYTDWGTAAEKLKILTLRLDKPKDKHLIGEIKVE
jgi:tetratricopeptide (TPR) repeat protein